MELDERHRHRVQLPDGSTHEHDGSNPVGRSRILSEHEDTSDSEEDEATMDIDGDEDLRYLQNARNDEDSDDERLRNYLIRINRENEADEEAERELASRAMAVRIWMP